MTRVVVVNSKAIVLHCAWFVLVENLFHTFLVFGTMKSKNQRKTFFTIFGKQVNIADFFPVFLRKKNYCNIIIYSIDYHK